MRDERDIVEIDEHQLNIARTEQLWLQMIMFPIRKLTLRVARSSPFRPWRISPPGFPNQTQTKRPRRSRRAKFAPPCHVLTIVRFERFSLRHTCLKRQNKEPFSNLYCSFEAKLNARSRTKPLRVRKHTL